LPTRLRGFVSLLRQPADRQLAEWQSGRLSLSLVWWPDGRFILYAWRGGTRREHGWSVESCSSYRTACALRVRSHRRSKTSVVPTLNRLSRRARRRATDDDPDRVLSSLGDPARVALFLPFARNKGRPTAANVAQRLPRTTPMFTGPHAAFGKARLARATRCKRPVSRLLTGGLLVRIQPEEPMFFE
jgi:hypothetical protein